MFGNGIGVAKDDSRAFAKYQKSCDGGSKAGGTNTGVLYQFGMGVPKDLAKAAESFTDACDTGNADGCSDLGFEYQYGRGVPPDKEKAIEFYSKACSMGNQFGCDQVKKFQHPLIARPPMSSRNRPKYANRETAPQALLDTLSLTLETARKKLASKPEGGCLYRWTSLTGRD